MNIPEDSALPSPPDVNPAISIEPAAGAGLALDPDDPPWGVLPAFLAFLTSVLLILVVPGIFALIYIATAYRGLPVSQEIVINDKNYILTAVIGILPAHLLILAIAWAVSSRLGKLSSLKTLGLSWPRSFGLWKSIGLAIILLVATIGLLYVWGGPDTDLERLLRSSRAAALVLAFLATVTAPAMEEVIYRGLLYSALQRAIGAIAAVLFVTAIFAGLHVWQYWPNAGAISAICLLSLVLTILRARTGKLLPSYVVHLVFNGVQSIIIVADPYIRPMIETPKPEVAPALIHLFLKIL